MKLFKKALVATAILGAFGVQAADVTDAVQKTSKQGLEVAANAGVSSVRVIVREQLEAGDIIYLEFGAGIDISALTLTDAVAAGSVVIGGDVTIKYGSGTYTLSSNAAESDLANNILALEVNTGDPVTKDSSFEIEITDAANLVDRAKVAQATVTYSAKSGLTGNAKDLTGDNTGSFYVLADQYTATVTKKLDGVINRNDSQSLVRNGILLANASNDATLDDNLVFSVSDNQNLLSATTAAGNTIAVSISGDFSDYTADLLGNGEAFLLDTAATPAALLSAAAGTNSIAKVSDSEILVTVFADSFAGNVFDDFQLVLTAESGAGTFPVTKFSGDAEVDFGGAAELEVLSGASFGEWILDATLITIPYFPVGFEGVDTSVHFANENATAVDVIINAFDDKGKEYSSTGLADLAKESVTKVSQTKIMELLGITTPTKLSITFNIDADENTVKAYAFSNAGDARQSLVTTQQFGK